jgi:hypothetical protein
MLVHRQENADLEGEEAKCCRLHSNMRNNALTGG